MTDSRRKSPEHLVASSHANEPNPASVALAREYPLLWAMGQEFDFAERLGGCTSELHKEVDRALFELFSWRQK